ncbi:MAG: OmpH family outer membrane protein [Prevotellaceae bacterium]|jgi:outer membrane protein|nr:OmpH family outer membrane protein [Prevotellaceae bacterium]
MKKNSYLIQGVLAMVTLFIFSQCTSPTNNPIVREDSSAHSDAGHTGLKVAYVELDSLIAGYYFWTDVNELSMKKAENIRVTLNQRANELRAEVEDFQRKLQNNAFLTRERAESEQTRLQKKDSDLQELSNRLQTEWNNEDQKNGLIIRDSIYSFLRDYNKEKKYDYILTKSGFDNVLYANEAYNITKEVIDGLNARYNKQQK